MHVALVTAELSPLTGKTGASELVLGLAKSIKSRGVRVTVVLPRFNEVRDASAMASRRLSPLLAAGDGNEAVYAFDLKLASGIEVLLVDSPELGAVGTTAGLPRFTRAAAAWLSSCTGAERVDVVHAQDLSVAGILGEVVAGERPRTVLSIHRVHLGVALPAADAITFDSARVRDAATHGTEDETRQVVAPAIDYGIWGPATDSLLKTHYDAERPEQKGLSKSALCQMLGLSIRPDEPLLWLEASGGAGVGAWLEVLPRLLVAGWSIVVSGAAHDVTRMVEENPGRMALIAAPTDTQTHQLYAGADFVGLGCPSETVDARVLIANRYGCPVVAAAEPSLDELVVNCDSMVETGTGFLADASAPAALWEALARASAAFRGSAWSRLVKRVMRIDASWDGPARRYEQLYRAPARMH